MGPLTSLLVAYGVGCVSFAGLASRLKGVDIRGHGSGNPGATNVGRLLGKGWGRWVLLLDIAKGYLPVLLLSAAPSGLVAGWNPPGWMVDAEGRTLIASAAVLGHVYPLSTRFRGGKGVATYVGVALALDPILAVLATLSHLLLKKALGFVAVASVALAWVFPVGQLVAGSLGPWGRFLDGPLVMASLALLITMRHRDNFRRIRAGREDRYDESRPAEGKEP